jgi:site-specific DNA-cytosine methylase
MRADTAMKAGPDSGLTATDLFCGAGGSSIGIEAAGGRLRMGANHWALAVDTHQSNFPHADHDTADISQVEPRRYPRTDVLWASPECFPAGQLVTTLRGQVPIEQVAVGDIALTHLGRWRAVVRTQYRQAATVIVKGQGHSGIEVTPNHRFWSRSSRRVWTNEVRDYVRDYGPEEWAQADALLGEQRLWATPTRVEQAGDPPSPPAALGLDPGAAWWLVGRWLGDGSMNRDGTTVVTCGRHEAVGIAERLADTGARWRRNDNRTAINFTLTGDVKAGAWLHEHFGHGAAGKGLPGWSLTLPRSSRQALLDGYVSADGHVGPRRTMASTVSRKMAVSVRLLAESLGHRVGMGTDRRTSYLIEGRHGQALPQHLVYWENQLSSKRRPESFEDGVHAWSRVRSVKPGRADVTVYNIEVEDDHSYVLDGIVVVNCTNHSQARGHKRRQAGQSALFGDVPDPAAERSRATMWDVVRFAEIHRYSAIIVENVVDAAAWELFGAWRAALVALGYDVHLVSLNSAHAGHRAGVLPAPQSRDRMYAVCVRAGVKIDLDFRPPCWCARCEAMVEGRQAWKNGRTVGRYRAQYVYVCPSCGQTAEPLIRPAAAAIDWQLVGQRIGDRARPLKPATVKRIEAGLRKYGRPITATVAGNTFERPGKAHNDPTDLAEPMPTRTTRESEALVVPPFLTVGREGAARRNSTLDEPPGAVCAGGNHNFLVEPPGSFIAELRGGRSDARSTDEPLATVTAGGNHHALVVPPGFVMRNNTARGGPDSPQMCTPFTEPLRTMTAAGHQSVVLLPPHLVVDYYRTGRARQASTEPMGTVTTVDRAALIDPADLLEDCLFRMLAPHEIGAAMSFPTTYTVLGSNRDRVRQYGNGVTPPAAADLWHAVVNAIGAAA